MDRSFSSKTGFYGHWKGLLCFTAGVFAAVGCDRSPRDVPKSPAPAAEPVPERVEQVCLTEDQRRSEELRRLVAAEENRQALSLASDLKRSSDRSVRLGVISAFGQVGGKSHVDLAEMLDDPDSMVANYALHEWGFVVDSLASTRAKVSAITNAATIVRKDSVIRPVFRHIIKLDMTVALPALECLITNSNTRASVVLCAKEAFGLLAREPWSSPARTLWVLQGKGK